MSKNLLAEGMAKAIAGEKYQSYNFITLFIEALVENLRLGRKIVISGFGTFSVKERKAKRVLNPVSKTAMIIPPQKSVKFLPSKILVKKIADDG